MSLWILQVDVLRSIRLRLDHTYRRRRRCIRSGHPMAEWSPVVMRSAEPDFIGPDGITHPGQEYTTRSWRCALHDRSPEDS